MAKNKETTYADVIQHFNDASRFATLYQQASRQYPILHQKIQYFKEQVARMLHLPSIDKTVLTAAVPLHMATAVFEAMQLTPLLQGIVFGNAAHTAADQEMLAMLTICTLLGSSLLAGYCFYNVSNEKDAVVPGRRHLSLGWLLGGLILSLLYVGSILWVVMKTTGVKTEFDVFYFLGLIAAIEVGLSAAAVVGYTIIFQYIQFSFMQGKLEKMEESMYRNAEKCALSFRYYRHSLILYNHQQNQNLPIVDTPAIAEAISFHEGYHKPRLD